MDMQAEPPPKCAVTDFKLCLYCQEDTGERLVDTGHNRFQCLSYTNFLDNVGEKAKFQNPDFVRVNQRLRYLDADQLQAKNATWHRACYSLVTKNTKRDEERFEKAKEGNGLSAIIQRKRGRPSTSAKAATQSTSDVQQRTRSTIPCYDPLKCVFCQSSQDESIPHGRYLKKQEEKLINCRTTNRGKDIEEIVSASNNQVWQIRLAHVLQSGDLLSRDILYHHSCYTSSWSKFIQARQKRKPHDSEVASEDTTDEEKPSVLAAEVQFLCSLQDIVDGGEFVSMADVEHMYEQAMTSFGVQPTRDRRMLKEMIEDNLDNVEITPSNGQTPSQVHSLDAAAAAIHAAAAAQRTSSCRERLKLLYKCSKQIRSAIFKSGRNWEFTGSLIDSLEMGVPEELSVFIQWIIRGRGNVSEGQREESIKRSANLISQNILQACKSDRQVNYKPSSQTSAFRNMYETPPAVGLSLYSHHLHRSKEEVNVLCKAGVGVSYDRVNNLTTQFASSSIEVMEANGGTYFPSGVLKGIPLRASIDNVDAKVDTSDGRNSFHGTACSVYQRIPPNTANQAVCEPRTVGKNPSQKALKDVPSTVIAMHACSVSGNPKPSRSPRYEEYRHGQHQHEVDSANQQDFAWLLARYFQRPRMEQNDHEEAKDENTNDINQEDASTSSINSPLPVNRETEEASQSGIRLGDDLSQQDRQSDLTQEDGDDESSTIMGKTSILIQETHSEQVLTVESVDAIDKELDSEPSQTERSCQQPKEQSVAFTKDSLPDQNGEQLSKTDTLPEQPVPVWRAYNSMLSTDDNQIGSDLQHSMPIINAPAHEWPTLVTALEHLHQLSRITCPDKNGKVMVTLDMDLYKRALKLEHLDYQYRDKWWLLPGPFHTSLCAIRCLGKTVEHSGLDDAWIKSKLYGRVVVNQIINGTHYNRAVSAHEITLQVLFDLWIDEFLAERPGVKDAIVKSMTNLRIACKSKDVSELQKAHQNIMIEIESMNLELQLNQFDQSRSTSPLYKWVRMYMRQVGALLNFHRSIKKPQLFLYLASLENLATYFFAYNRLDYSQNILEFVARVYQSKDTDPEIWESMLIGEFAHTASRIPFSSIGLDQAQEHAYKSIKGDGGIKGITTNPSALLKYCLAAPELSRIAHEYRDMLSMPPSCRDQHHLLSKGKTSQQEHAIKELKAVICPKQIFKKGGDCSKLHNFMTGKVVTEETQASILGMEERGEQAKTEFVESRIRGEENLWKKMTKLKFKNWDQLCKKVKLKSKGGVLHLKSASTMLSRLLVVAKSQRHLDLEEVISQYELNAINTVLMDDSGELLPCKNKSKLIHALLEMSQDETEEQTENSHPTQPPQVKKHLIVDAMAVVQAIVSSNNAFQTFRDVGKAFTKSIDSIVRPYAGSHIIFDNYHKKLTLKEDIRYSTEGEEVIIKDSTPVTDIKKIMASSKSKDSLTLYLADTLMKDSNNPIITVTRRDVLSNRSALNCTAGVSTQEEADTLMVLHGLELAQAGIDVDFYTQDTDWWVLLLRRLPDVGQNTCILTGPSENRTLIPLKSIYDKLGMSRASALPGFHALTGSDTTGRLRGVGKKTALDKLLVAPDNVVEALIDLGKGEAPQSSVISGCEEFVCMLLSTRDASATSAASLRWKKFKKLKPTQGIDKLPPTPGAILQHTLRAHLQASIWAQDDVVDPVIYDPCKLGWCKNGPKLSPKLTEMDSAPGAVTELIKCNCVSTLCSTMRCTCKSNNLQCTELCTCNASEDCCNIQAVADDSDEDEDEV